MKVVVTGAASDFGGAIMPSLFADGDIDEVLGIDLREPHLTHSKFKFEREDIRSARMRELFDGATAVVHLAFVVEEIRDKELTHDVNLNGSKNVIHSAHDAGVKRLVLASSVSAYGSHSDYPRRVTEEDFPRGDFDKYYFYDKAEVEHYVEWWLDQNPEAEMAIALLRPPTVIGPSISNSLVDLLAAPVATWPTGTFPLQLLHERDLARAFHGAVKGGASGPFNLGTEDSVSVEDLAKIHGQRLIRGSLRFFERAANIAYRLRLSPVSSQWATLGDPIVSNSRAEKELGWQPQFTSEECAYIHLVQRGRPILDGEADRIFSRKEAAEAALEPSTGGLKGWVRKVEGLSNALDGPEDLDRFIEHLEHVFIPYKHTAVHLEVYSAEDEAAPTVVFSPGLGAYARFYLPLLGKLCDEGLNVVAIDRPGHGLSEGRRGDVSWQATLDVVEEAVRYARERFVGPVVLAGSSLGGIITWFALTRQPDIDAAFCHNIAHPRVFHEPAMKIKVPLLKQLARIARHAPISVKQLVDFNAVSGEPTILESFERQEDRIFAWNVSARGVAGLFNYVPPVEWAEVETPTLIVVGENDRMVTSEFTRQVLDKGRPKNAEVKLLPGLGHLIFHDHLDQTLPLLAGFVRETVGAKLPA